MAISFQDSCADPSLLRQHEQALILAIASRIDARLIFEFGPQKTNRSSQIARELEDGTLAIITDQSASGAMTGQESRAAGLLTPEAVERTETIRHVDAFRGRNARLEYAPWIGACDLVIVNASHEYDFVKCDSLTALRLVKPGGIVLWSDYGAAPSLTHCVNTLSRTVRSLASLRRITGTNLCFWRRGD